MQNGIFKFQVPQNQVGSNHPLRLLGTGHSRIWVAGRHLKSNVLTERTGPLSSRTSVKRKKTLWTTVSQARHDPLTLWARWLSAEGTALCTIQCRAPSRLPSPDGQQRPPSCDNHICLRTQPRGPCRGAEHNHPQLTTSVPGVNFYSMIITWINKTVSWFWQS